MIIDNTDSASVVIAQSGQNAEKMIKNDDIWNILIAQSKNNG